MDGREPFFGLAVALYGAVLFMCGGAYFILAKALTKAQGKSSRFARELGSMRKEMLSMLIYPLGMALGFVQSLLGFSLYVIVALLWLIPDRRFEPNQNSSGPAA